MANEQKPNQQQQADKPKAATVPQILDATNRVASVLAEFNQNEQRRILAGAVQAVGLPQAARK